MEVSKRKEVTIVEIRSIVVGDHQICSRIKRVDGHVAHITLERVIKEDEPLIPNSLYLYSMEEVQAALELLKSIVEREEIGETDGR